MKGVGPPPAGSSRDERLLEREGREQLGAVCGEKDLLLELDALPAGSLAAGPWHEEQTCLLRVIGGPVGPTADVGIWVVGLGGLEHRPHPYEFFQETGNSS